jgi:ferredoxin-thioredoxin reductase catalytic subunit
MMRLVSFLIALSYAAMAFTTSCNSRATSSSQSLLLMGKADDMSEEQYALAMEKATKSMTAFTNKYLKNTNTTLCSDKSVAAVVIKGLAENKVNLGSPLCPCRFYDDKEAEAKDGYWNCPCVPMREGIYYCVEIHFTCCLLHLIKVFLEFRKNLPLLSLLDS